MRCLKTPLSGTFFFILLQIRVPAFLDLFMQSLFKPGSKINQDHKHKYIHILAYAASVVETWKKVPNRGPNLVTDGASFLNN